MCIHIHLNTNTECVHNYLPHSQATHSIPGWYGNKAKYNIPQCSLIPRLIVSSRVSLGLRLVSMWPFTYLSSSSSGLHFLLIALLLCTWHLGGGRSTSSHTHGHCNQVRNTEMNAHHFLSQPSIKPWLLHSSCHTLYASFIHRLIIGGKSASYEALSIHRLITGGKSASYEALSIHRLITGGKSASYEALSIHRLITGGNLHHMRPFPFPDWL